MNFKRLLTKEVKHNLDSALTQDDLQTCFRARSEQTHKMSKT